MMQKIIISLGLMIGFLNGHAQLYFDASNNLPSNGARGQSMDVQAVDIDDDNDLDLVLANEFQINVILLNNGDGQFVKAENVFSPELVHDSEDVAIADFDLDGDLDLIFCSEDDVTMGALNVHEYYLNNGSGHFNIHPSFQFNDSKSNAVIAVDINGDFRMDVIFGNDGQNDLYINNGDGTFTEESSTRLPNINDTTQDLNVADVDDDGDLDLFVGNENGNRLLINNGLGVFTDETSVRLPNLPNVETRKVSFGDVNGDNTPDVFLSNVRFIPGGNRQNRLLLNDGNGVFLDATATHLPADSDDTLDGIFEDVDEDGDLDLIIANVNLQSLANQKIYRNEGDGHFVDATLDVLDGTYGGNALGVITADLNNDGLKDIYFCERNTGSGSKDLLFLKNLVNATSQPASAAIFEINPNPVSDQFLLRFASPIRSAPRFELLDSSSHLLFPLQAKQQNDQTFQFTLAQQRLSPGLYFLHIILEEKSWTAPLIFKR